MPARPPLRGRAAALAAVEAKSLSTDGSSRIGAPDTPRSSDASRPAEGTLVAVSLNAVDVPRQTDFKSAAHRWPVEPVGPAVAAEMGEQPIAIEASSLQFCASPSTHAAPESMPGIAPVPRSEGERASAVAFETARRDFQEKAERARFYSAVSDKTSLGAIPIGERLASLEALWHEYENETPSYPRHPEDDTNVPLPQHEGRLQKHQLGNRVSRPWPGEPIMMREVHERDMPWSRVCRDEDLPPPPPLKEHPLARAARQGRELGTSPMPADYARRTYCESLDACSFAITSRGRFDAR